MTTTDKLAPSAPYPPETRAKGWRFELDYEQIEQSDTWDLAAEIPMAQHALLMMWLVAWRQDPCGSLPADEAIIRAKCRIPPDTWAACRDVCMRGWWLADDGRLYHPTLTKRVLEMIEYRRKEAARRAGNRGKAQDSPAPDAGVPRDTSGTDGGVTPDSTASPDTGTGTGTTQQDKPVVKGRRAAAPAAPDDVDAQVWTDWLDLRRKKRAPVTPTVLEGARSEAAKAGMSFEAFLRIWCRRGSQGLEADWIKPAERQQQHSGETPWQRSQREKVAAFSGGALGRAPGRQLQTIDMEPSDA